MATISFLIDDIIMIFFGSELTLFGFGLFFCFGFGVFLVLFCFLSLFYMGWGGGVGVRSIDFPTN